MELEHVDWLLEQVDVGAGAGGYELEHVDWLLEQVDVGAGDWNPAILLLLVYVSK